MDMLVEFIPIGKAYHTVEDIGLRREFLVHFGQRAASSRVKNDGRTEEVTFWVSLLQNQLLRAIDRERIWSKLTTSETIEVSGTTLKMCNCDLSSIIALKFLNQTLYMVVVEHKQYDMLPIVYQILMNS